MISLSTILIVLGVALIILAVVLFVVWDLFSTFLFYSVSTRRRKSKRISSVFDEARQSTTLLNGIWNAPSNTTTTTPPPPSPEVLDGVRQEHESSSDPLFEVDWSSEEEDTGNTVVLPALIGVIDEQNNPISMLEKPHIIYVSDEETNILI